METNQGGGGNAASLWIVFSSAAVLSQLSRCLSLPICFLNTMLLEAHQPWSVSCYRREVKRLFQLLSYWLRPPSGQARPSVNPARNERRSLPTEKVSLWVYVMCPPALTRQIGSAGGRRKHTSHVCSECVRMREGFFVGPVLYSAFGISKVRLTSHTCNLFPIPIIYLNQIYGQMSSGFWSHGWSFVQQSMFPVHLPASWRL